MKEELLDVFSSEWFAETSNSTTPGEIVKIYRENHNLTQEQLGKKLGNFTRQNISDIELGRRGLSKEVAKKLSKNPEWVVDVPSNAELNVMIEEDKAIQAAALASNYCCIVTLG